MLSLETLHAASRIVVHWEQILGVLAHGSVLCPGIIFCVARLGRGVGYHADDVGVLLLPDAVETLERVAVPVQGYLARKKLPPPLRAATGPLA